MNVMTKISLTAVLIVAAFALGHRMGEVAEAAKCIQKVERVYIGDALIIR